MCLPPELSFRQCEQLLEVAPPVQETKYAIALEVYGRLLNLECDKQIAAHIVQKKCEEDKRGENVL